LSLETAVESTDCRLHGSEAGGERLWFYPEGDLGTAMRWGVSSRSICEICEIGG
jgi:ferredoxin-like protein FixX